LGRRKGLILGQEGQKREKLKKKKEQVQELKSKIR